MDRTVALVERPDPSSSVLGVQIVDSKRINKKSPTDLIELAQEIQKADEFTRATASSKLQVIAEQVRFLQEQARKILEEARQSDDLHHIACNFKKIPGKIYYLYRRPSGQRYFSMLSPEEWGPTCPHTYLGSYRLEADMSWTEDSKLDQRDRDLASINQILDANRTMSLSLAITANDSTTKGVQPIIWEPKNSTPQEN